MRAAILSLILATAPALAETPMSATAFEAYTTGKTLYYGDASGPYGAEEYLEGRRVRWSFLDGDCMEGAWYENGPDICFVYEHNPTPQCWQFFDDGAGISAEFMNDGGRRLYEVSKADEPMLCLGPKVGV